MVRSGTPLPNKFGKILKRRVAEAEARNGNTGLFSDAAASKDFCPTRTTEPGPEEVTLTWVLADHSRTKAVAAALNLRAGVFRKMANGGDLTSAHIANIMGTAVEMEGSPIRMAETHTTQPPAALTGKMG